MDRKKEKNVIIIFLCVTFILSSICYYIYIAGGQRASEITALLMWCPGIAAIAVKKIFYKRENVFGFNKCNINYIFWGVFIPLIYLAVSYGIYWLANPGSFTATVYTNSGALLIFAVFSAILTSMGEEIGWRGFLLPKLVILFERRKAIVICGIVWAIWHFPLMVNGAYQSGTPLWYKLPMFTIEVVLITAVLAYLRFHSDSIWPAVVFHASHNYIDQLFTDPLTDAEYSAFFVGETGVVTVVCLVIVVLILYRSRLGSYLVIHPGITKQSKEWI